MPLSSVAVAGLSFKGKKNERKGFVMPTETNLHGNALCFTVNTWARPKTTETVLSNGWRRLAVGGWRLVVLGGCPNKKKLGFSRTALGRGRRRCSHIAQHARGDMWGPPQRAGASCTGTDVKEGRPRKKRSANGCCKWDNPPNRCRTSRR